MSSFRAKLGWKRLRKSENKSYHSVSFRPDAKYIISKNSKKIQNIKKKYCYGYISRQNRMEKVKNERK